MNVSRRWLEAFLRRPLDVAATRDRLTRLGAAVDAVEPRHHGLGDIRVALVLDVQPHPDADRLRLCRVDDGGTSPLTIVCGAPNVTAGRRYPFAPLGATLPGGLRIERRRIRGIASEGMLCSARELGLGEDHAGLWELDTDARPGTPLLEAIPLDDDVFVLDVTPNRGDLLSHKGVARELAASLGVPFRLPEIPGAAGDDLPPPVRAGATGATAGVTVAIEDAAACPRFLAAVVRGVRPGPAPAWLRQRLEAVGVRPINAVVDATNYVMLELGQPMHAYDLAQLRGGRIAARTARAGERLVTLDGTERALPEGAPVIVDGERVVGVAGIMGGADTEVSAGTTDVLLECAAFDARQVRRARRALGLATEASQRFERGTDRWAAPDALRRCLEVLRAVAGGTLADAPVDCWPEPTHPPRVFVRLGRVTQVLGVELPLAAVERALVAVGCTVLAKPDDHRLAVDVPGWRPDLREEIDLIEEIARQYGYDNLPTELRPFRVGAQPDAPMAVLARRLRAALAGEGLCEAVALPFAPPDPAGAVAVQNPLSAEEGFLRRRLLPGLVRQAERNWAAMTRDVRLFELGTVFTPAAPGAWPGEARHVACVLTGRRDPAHWAIAGGDFTLWDLKGLLERVVTLAHPGGRIQVEGDAWLVVDEVGHRVGWAGALDADRPRWAAPLYGLEVALHDGPRPVPRIVPPPVTPAAERDVALLLPDGLALAEVLRVLRDAEDPLLEAVDVLSEFRGGALPAGVRSVALRLRWRAADRTLRDAEVDAAERALLVRLRDALGVERRGGDGA